MQVIHKKKTGVVKGEVPKDPSAYPLRTGKIFKDRTEFDEAVRRLLMEHQSKKSTGIFY